MVTSNPSFPINLGPQELALARHLTYDLLGKLYLEGVTAVTLPTLQIIPSLAQTITRPFNHDESAASHQELFSFNVFPYESIFLDGSGLLGGPAADAVLRSYQAAGFIVDAGSTSPDHIGHELGLLSHLCAAEADAWEDNLTAAADRMRHLQRNFLQSHLLRWLVPFVVAIKQQERPFYTALAQLSLDFIYDHWQEITTDASLPLMGNSLPEPPDLLGDEKTGLKEIATYLITPPYSGLFLSRNDITRLTRSQDIPHGFGDRTQILTNLLRGAAQFEALPNLLSDVQELLRVYQNEYTKATREMRGLTRFIAAWQAQIAETDQLLTQIKQQIESA
ncbi:MAG: molecular chaperone TorD family protein [Ardenticatenaceae bacterium]|nr:molecular chaperone TorD family protein [Ardenticatenaceae bacterium]MCB9443385.1 molecular chaperone TorD family protein [Ardenticatenaceae bacterium]